MLVLAGHMTKSEGARALGLTRTHFQSLCHRLMVVIIEFLVPSKGGRPRMSETERRLRAENRHLQKLNERLSHQVEKQQVQIEVMGRAIRSRPRAHSPRGGRGEPEDSEVAQRMLSTATEMILRGVALKIVAIVLGIAICTLRRYAARSIAGVALVSRRGPAPKTVIDDSLVEDVTSLLDETRGRMGAVCLSRKTGASRRDCAMIKRRVLTDRERHRKRCSLRLRVCAPGIMRSFDQLYVRISGIKRIILVCADACVPFRTTISLVSSYDTRNVSRVIARDIARFGAPLLWRMDRAKSHMSAVVLKLLEELEVLPLFGPPRHPGYYGQMERMNREHRDWLSHGPVLTHANINHELEHMRRVLNETLIRPTLNYRSAADRWGERRIPRIDRKCSLCPVVS